MCTTEFAAITPFLNHHPVYGGFKIWTNALIHTLSFNRWGLISLLGVWAGLSDSFFVKSGNDGVHCQDSVMKDSKASSFLSLSALSFWEQSATRSSRHSKSPTERLGGQLLTACEWGSEPSGWHLGCSLIRNPNLDHLATPLSDSWPTELARQKLLAVWSV